jgi:hypothetical protein
MPNLVPTLASKLVPLWDFAYGAGVDPKALRDELRAAGVLVHEITVGGQHSAFVERDALDRFVMRSSGSQAEAPAPQPIPDEMQARSTSDWGVALQVWDDFVVAHPELALRQGYWQLTNFMRKARPALLACDAIRKVNSRHWIAHRERFAACCFEVVTTSSVDDKFDLPNEATCQSADASSNENSNGL